MTSDVVTCNQSSETSSATIFDQSSGILNDYKEKVDFFSSLSLSLFCFCIILLFCSTIRQTRNRKPVNNYVLFSLSMIVLKHRRLTNERERERASRMRIRGSEFVVFISIFLFHFD